MSESSLYLPARQPFQLTTVIRSHGWIQLEPFSQSDDNQTLYYIDRLEGQQVLALAIETDREGVNVKVTNGDGKPIGLAQAERDQVSTHVRWMLNLDADFSDFYRLAADEPKLTHVVEMARGRVLRSPTLFEDVVKTILTTNVAWGGTKGMVRRLVQNFGAPLPGHPERRAFPSPEELAASTPETLKEVGRFGYRAPHIHQLALRVASGNLDLEELKTADLPTAELRKELLAINGVGPYAAANLLMILGRYDFIPIDSWAFKMVSNEWYGGEAVGPKEVEAAFANWGRYKGLAYWFWDWSAES